MFTGIIQTLGTVKTRQGSSLEVEGRLGATKIGDSVAVEGVCLTVTRVSGRTAKRLRFDVSAETFDKTTLGSLKTGGKVNLETALRAGQPLGGHFVLGHVDGTGKVISKTAKGNAMTLFEFSVPLRLHRHLASKGSVAVDGISLTVVEVKDHSFTVAVIPHTLENTTLSRKKAGDAVNLETDVLAKHVEALLRGRDDAPEGGLFIKKSVDWDELMREEGYK